MDQDTKDYNKLQAYSNAQTNTIIELSRKLKGAQDEISHLKKLLEGSVPLIKPEGSSNSITSNAGDQEYICRTEINKLRDISRDRELTLEECKKLDIYSKILKDLASNPPKYNESEAKKASTAELLALVKTGEDNI